MALRVRGELQARPTSAAPGDEVAVEAKVENTAAQEGALRLEVDVSPRGGVGPAPTDHGVAFEPASTSVPGRKRERVRFVWRAHLPEGVDALTYRGTLRLVDAATGDEVARGPLDVHVRRGG